MSSLKKLFKCTEIDTTHYESHVINHYESVKDSAYGVFVLDGVVILYYTVQNMHIYKTNCVCLFKGRTFAIT